MKRNVLIIGAVASMLLCASCNSSSEKVEPQKSSDSVSVDTVSPVAQKNKIQKILIYDKKNQLQYTDEFAYNQQGQLASTNGGATAISYDFAQKESSIMVKTNGCSYAYLYNESGNLYLLKQVGPDWKMNMDLVVEQGKLKKVSAHNIDFREEAVWQDGNLQSYIQYDEGEKTTLSYTYKNLENPFDFDLIGYLNCTENRLPYMNVRYLSKEAVSKNLPTTITRVVVAEGEKPQTEKYSLSYKLDSENRVTKIIVSGKKTYEIVYAD